MEEAQEASGTAPRPALSLSKHALGQRVLGLFVSRASRPLSLRVNLAWTTAGDMVYSACQWGMLSLIAKLGSPEAVGQFSLALAVTAPVVMFTNLQLRELQATDARTEFGFEEYAQLRIVMTLLALVVIYAAARLSGFGREVTLTVMVIGLAKGFEAASDIIYGLLQKHERMDRIATSMMLKGVLSLLVLGATLYLTGRMLWASVGLAASWLAVLLICDLRNARLIVGGRPAARHVRPNVNPVRERPSRPRRLARLAWMALPLGVVSMLVSLRANLPRYWVHQHLGEWGVGIYSALAYSQVATAQVAGALARTISPRLATYHDRNRVHAFRRLLSILVGTGVLMGAAGAVAALIAGRQLLTLLYRAEYGEHAGLLLWVMIASGVGNVGSALTCAMTVTRQLREQALLYAAVVGTTALTCAILVPTRGLQGAVAALLISGLAQVAIALPWLVRGTRGGGGGGLRHAQAYPQPRRDDRCC